MPWQIREDPLGSLPTLPLLRKHLATLAPTALFEINNHQGVIA